MPRTRRTAWSLGLTLALAGCGARTALDARDAAARTDAPRAGTPSPRTSATAAVAERYPSAHP